MYLFKTVADLKKFISVEKQTGKQIGFVPTMGALHNGHLSLIKESLANTDLSVCSIFVNPTQFDDATDLEKYPRTLEKDLEMLHDCGNHVVFAPSANEVYPKGLNTQVEVNLGKLASVMEGEFRPGHFEGMMQVVNRLLDIVMPEHLFMGQKDFQQAAIVKEMIKQTSRSTKLHICPIIREENGLARSSRNERLTDKQRDQAKALRESLLYVKANKSKAKIESLKTQALEIIQNAGMEPVYFEIVDGDSLQSISSFEESNYPVACLAAFMGEIRLIDNVIL